MPKTTAAFLLAALWFLPTPGRGQDVYVSNDGTQTVGEYTSSGTPINASFATIPDNFFGIAVAGGDLFVVEDSSVNSVAEYNATTGALINGSLITGLVNPSDIVAFDGNLYVGSWGLGGNTGTIGEYSSSGATVNASLVTGLHQPQGFAVAGGDLIVTDASGFTDRIGEYDAATGAAVNPAFITGLTGDPLGLAVSGGDVFVTNYVAGTVGEYNATTGATVNASLIGGLAAPDGIAAFGGSLFVTNLNGTIGEYTTSGAVVNAALVTGLSSPVRIAVVATPEPSSVALLGLGAIGLWAMALRRKVRSAAARFASTQST